MSLDGAILGFAVTALLLISMITVSDIQAWWIARRRWNALIRQDPPPATTVPSSTALRLAAAHRPELNRWHRKGHE